MSVFTNIDVQNIAEISELSGICFNPATLNYIEEGSTDSCFSLKDYDHKKYFLKIHENQKTSPHSVNRDLRLMVEFAEYLSCSNEKNSYLEILAPYKWKDGKVYGYLNGLSNTYTKGKIMSIWPFVNPNHPMPIRNTQKYPLCMIERFGKATAELHNLSLGYVPKKIITFPKDIFDTARTIKKIKKNENAIIRIDEAINKKDNHIISNSEVFLKILNDKVDYYSNEWCKRKLNEILEMGYIHGELKPTNTLISIDKKVIFIDICKAGLGPLTLELGMAAQHFSDIDTVNIKGIECFIESYLSVRRDFIMRELKYIPLMIKVSALRLAAYRAFAVSKGLENQKSILTPLNICLEMEELEDDLKASLTS
ncbi:phosphotransferase [Alkalihalobacillus sp. LMS39]|uniref:phosphotransferase n=1 Tax=Alkalihalobacillus sp. LMS39 TaxID=2924032 RepID=UPI001FB1AD8F|nr:phosphotransferase [Alkalihalobacillus sp. LMS39]UOE95087.1 hypothetical protein MM271_05510 [Alkalihalobacillus sp. LMS39]